jgi:uncharacterized protein YjbJ (UPF0337 family)
VASAKRSLAALACKHSACIIAKNAAERVSGNVKEKVGDLTDNESLEAEGRREQGQADRKDAGENVKDAAKKVADAFDR